MYRSACFDLAIFKSVKVQELYDQLYSISVHTLQNITQYKMASVLALCFYKGASVLNLPLLCLCSFSIVIWGILTQKKPYQGKIENRDSVCH